MSGQAMIIQSETLTNIANAIRSKYGISGQLSPSQIVDSIIDPMEDLVNSIANKTITRIDLSSISTIRNRAFDTYENLSSVNFLNVTAIGESAFYKCSNLYIINFPYVMTIERDAFRNCTNLIDISVPNVETIESHAFRNCQSLSTITLPNVKTIKNEAFTSCVRLVSLYLNNVTSVPSLGLLAFYSTPISKYSAIAGRYGSIYVPSSLLTKFKTATYWSELSKRMVGV